MLCAGYKGAFAIDDAYCAGRIVALLGARADRRGGRRRAVVAERFPSGDRRDQRPHVRPAGLEEDIAWCAREGVLDVVPRFARMIGPGAEIVA